MKTTLLFLSVFLSVSLFGQNVYIPDANFKAYLVGNPEINTNGDTEIQVSEASVYGGSILCDNLFISDLTGIEAFTSLTELFCEKNQLTSIDVSQNQSLELLVLYDNFLTDIDVSNNSELWVLNVGNFSSLNNMQLTSLDVTNNPKLEGLNCQGNLIGSLDLSQNPLMEFLLCGSNLLTCLDITGTNLAQYSFENPSETNFYANMNPLLTCIEVSPSDLNYVLNNFTQIDSQTSFSLDCNNDCSSSSSLTELSTSKNLIQILDLMGRETSFKPNTPLIYVYDDGSTEKVFSVEY
ncbi:hypothetical protein N9I21_01730 [Crocinitomicaceae bacterium]|nr:hypothetical protein [Crocinitomicaceae bacterium]